eukprot:TRINITY_DN27785_c0_g1_i1.p1 TRINITY_DN27785_c0_g1~~TRINITY_DN27785_c0_g1_i1.p1  ORF type:complete len:573 (+),score=131.39 TRINITY_DN27785_c0_g1_i1:71-1789(+)
MQSAKRRRVAAAGGAASAAAASSPAAGSAYADLLNPQWLAEGARAEQVARYRAGTPYPHLVVDSVLSTAGIASLIEEADTKLEATFKETDLFKMYQTLDLGNLDPKQNPTGAEALRAKLPHFAKLRELYSSREFREFAAALLGVEPTIFTDRVDLALQAYSKGGHLLCHDDVIGTRLVSFILYLTDADWGAADGGGLELYAADATGNLPRPEPERTVLPLRNTMALFRVVPGQSFHAVAETLTDRAPRLSLQGWLHAAQAPQGAGSLASLAVLKGLSSGAAAKGFDPLPQGAVPEGGLTDLTQADLDALRQWVASEYLTREGWEAVRSRFQKEGSAVLRNFLRPEVAQRVAGHCAAADAAGAPGGGWAVCGPPITQRFLSWSGGGSDAAGRELDGIRGSLFNSVPFARLLSCLTSLTVLGRRSAVRRFRPGSDYTVAHHALLEPDTRLDATLCFTDPGQGAPEQGARRAAWASGEVGGFECYLAADESSLEAAETYGNKGDEGNDLLSFHCAHNTLSLVARDEGMLRFVKYVSAAAPASRLDIAAEYEILCDASSDEDGPAEEPEEAEEAEE